MTVHTPPPPAPPIVTPNPLLRRSGAVARLLGMPAATLRVWERRYGLTQAQLSASGQRLYSTDDVQRLALIKQLNEKGHAIGTLAPLAMPALQQLAASHTALRWTVGGNAPSGPTRWSASRPWRLAVIGSVLATRLQRLPLLQQLALPVQLLGPYDTPAQAAAAVSGSDVDALVVHQPRLHAEWPDWLKATAPALVHVPTAVLYGFATDAVCESVADTGAVLLREPQPDVVVAQWLRHLAMTSGAPPTGAEDATTAPAPAPRPAPRRWDDAALAEFAGRLTTVACECPRHLAELLVQLAHFERYSAECAHRNAADAALHAHLQNVAAGARASFEAALEHLALHEGLPLPATRHPITPGMKDA